MADEDKTTYYRPVPGSRELTTSSVATEDVLKLLEQEHADPAVISPQRHYKGEWLGGVKMGEGLALPLSLFDRLLPLQSPLEQAVFIHLFRLSYGEGKNFCRVGKRELTNRARVSDRRLNVALDGLVRKGHLKPLHRDTNGTLYRVRLPSEVLGEGLEPGIEAGARIELARREEPPEPAARTPKAKAKTKPAPRRDKPLESPLNEESFADVTGKKPKGPSIAELADRFFTQRGLPVTQPKRQMAVTVITDLLEDGFSRDEVARALEWYIVNAPAEKNLDRLPYHIGQALEESD